MSKENSKSGASNSTRRKFEHLTKESGFDGDVTNPSAIVGETETGVGGAGSGSEFLVAVPSSGSHTYAAFQNVMGQDTAIQGGEIPTEDQGTNGEDDTFMNGEENYVVVSLNETEGVVPVLEAASANGQQEMVLASNQQNIAGDPQVQANNNDSVRKHPDAIQLEQKNAELKKLKKELSDCKLSESQLKEKVNELTKEIEKLTEEKENLEQKEVATKKTKEEQQQHIAKLVTQLKNMAVKVEKVKRRLAAAEKVSVAEKKQLEKQIDTLEEERKSTKSAVDKLHVDEQKSKEQILSLTEKLSQKNDELNKKNEELSRKKDEEIQRTKEHCELQVKYANAKTEIANQKTQLMEQKLQIEKNEHKEQLKIEKDSSQAQIQQLQNKDDCSQAHIQQLLTRIESLEKEKSIEEATNKPKSSQTTPTLVDPPLLCIDHQTSETESSASLSSLRPSTGTQNSLTESTGAPSRTSSTPGDVEQSTESIETKTNGDVQPGKAGFTISDSTLDIPELQDTT